MLRKCCAASQMKTAATATPQSSPYQPLEILPVRSKDEQRGFLRLPWSLYAHDPAWVPPLLVERRHHLSERNPYFRHATFQAWIARRGSQTVGRISAQVDRLHLQRYDDQTGFFGLIEAQDDPEVFTPFFKQRKDGCVSRGCAAYSDRSTFPSTMNAACLSRGTTPPHDHDGTCLALLSRAY